MSRGNDSDSVNTMPGVIFLKKSKNCHVSKCYHVTWQWQWHMSILCQVSFS